METTPTKWYRKTWVQVLMVVLAIGFVLNIKQHRNPAPGKHNPAVYGSNTELDSAAMAEAATKTVADIPSEDREALIKKQFSSWDGSHRAIERAIKKAMNDPDSYEHNETSYQDMGDHLLVTTSYRGTNGFGAKILNSVTCKVDFAGNIIEVVEE